MSIPFNSSYGYVEALLEAMDTIADVGISIAGEGSSVCGQDDEAVTRVEFLQDFGSLPAARVRQGPEWTYRIGNIDHFNWALSEERAHR